MLRRTWRGCAFASYTLFIGADNQGSSSTRATTANRVSNSGAYSGMDTPICHGTSGSGVFLSGQNVLIGPTISGGPSWTDSNGNSRPALCHRMDQVPAGQMASSHVRSSTTHQFVAGSPEVIADR